MSLVSLWTETRVTQSSLVQVGAVLIELGDTSTIIELWQQKIIISILSIYRNAERSTYAIQVLIEPGLLDKAHKC
jgi:hypothetical protein